MVSAGWANTALRICGKTNNISDSELEFMIQEGENARRELAKRTNARLDARNAELDIEINSQKLAIDFMKCHKALQTLPIIQKQIDKVIVAMEHRQHLICSEKGNIRYSRMSAEELLSQPSAW